MTELNIGDRITIQGMRIRKDGTFTKRCKPGNETVFVLKKVFPSHKKLAILPAILPVNE